MKATTIAVALTLAVISTTTSAKKDDNNNPQQQQQQQHEQQQHTACLTSEECKTASGLVMETVESFHIGNFPSKGCYSKGNKVFWSDGTAEEMSEGKLSGVRVRIWCDDEDEEEATTAATTAANAVVTNAATTPDTTDATAGAKAVIAATTAVTTITTSTTTTTTTTTTTPPLADSYACLTEDDCFKMSQVLNYPSLTTSNTFPTKGCYSKNGKAYFSLGSTEESMSTLKLPGRQERIWCDGREMDNDILTTDAAETTEATVPVITSAPSLRPTKSPSSNPMKIVTGTPTTKEPTNNPTNDILSLTPTKSPSTTVPSNNNNTTDVLATTNAPSPSPTETKATTNVPTTTTDEVVTPNPTEDVSSLVPTVSPVVTDWMTKAPSINQTTINEEMDDGLPQVVSPPKAIQTPDDANNTGATIYNHIEITFAIVGSIVASSLMMMIV